MLDFVSLRASFMMSFTVYFFFYYCDVYELGYLILSIEGDMFIRFWLFRKGVFVAGL